MYSLIISVLPVIVLAIIIYINDKNKEPAKLLFKLFISGFLSVIITLIISGILELSSPIFKDSTDLTIIQLFISIYIGVGLVEEFSKWIMVYSMSYHENEFDEMYDMIVYSTFVSLGFACIENILYVMSKGIYVGIIRAILSVPGHAFFGVFMGYYLGLAKISSLNNNKKLETKNKYLSIIVPTLLHGTFDYLLSLESIIYLILFLVFVVLLYIYAIKKIKRISNIARKLKYKDNYCSRCGTKVETNYCPTCGRKNE
ncbi:MAG: PrsW family intramembrane metalloprotease [Bacilli bacterium]|nr:PrsW family intramembrane metalloprotease [Bacilli bacterium]